MALLKKIAAKTTANTAPQQDVSTEERIRMIAEAAYYRAERRGFQEGNQDADWLEAEKEVEVILSRPPERAPKKK